MTKSTLSDRPLFDESVFSDQFSQLKADRKSLATRSRDLCLAFGWFILAADNRV